MHADTCAFLRPETDRLAELGALVCEAVRAAGAPVPSGALVLRFVECREDSDALCRALAALQATRELAYVDGVGWTIGGAS